MEQELLTLLERTQESDDGTRKHAELELREYSKRPGYASSLSSIAAHTSISTNLRQSALLTLRRFVLEAWSPNFDEFRGTVVIADAEKEQLRNTLLELSTSQNDDRKVKSSASYVLSKIASADYPDQWPTLLGTLLQLIANGNDGQIHGALKVLLDLVDEGLDEEQFFRIARDLIKILFDTAANESRKPTLRALAVSVFRSCFDTLEMVMEDHKAEVKGFADEAISGWLPLIMTVLKTRLPQTPGEEDEASGGGTFEDWRGLIALKLQIVKTLMKIRQVFPAILSPQSPALFSATWEELSSLQGPYHDLYVNDERQGRLEDADGLPYTLDFLVIEELDFMQACLRAPPVRKELESQLQNQSAAQEGGWLVEVMKLAVAYAHITTEEEGLWDIDVNVFLSEETSVTANYTPRTACGDLMVKLGEWLKTVTLDGLLAYTKSIYSSTESWKAKEACLFLLNQILNDFQDIEQTVSPELAKSFSEFINHAIEQEPVFLRTRGFLVAGLLVRTSGEALHNVAGTWLNRTLHAITQDSSEVVKVSCIKVLPDYLQSLPTSQIIPLQAPIASAIAHFLSSQDPNELKDADDLLVALVDTLRDVIRLDTNVCISGNPEALNLLFSVANQGAENFQITMLVNEAFEEIAESISSQGMEAYIRLCERVLPSLTGAFDIAEMTQQSSLVNLAVELLNTLAGHGLSPLPNGFVAAVMPKLNRLLLSNIEPEVLRPATETVKHILSHDSKQLLGWTDASTGKPGLEVCLVIIDRLLAPSIDDGAAAEVGGLAAELVEQAGAEKLGPYLLQLLRAVAIRLASARQAAFIQSLTLVFARLTLSNAKDVIDFLAQVEVDGQNGLQVVMGKWLENSVNFAGYDEIRQNVMALSKIYNLHDPRLAQIMVQGDLIVPQSDRIMTRSKARQNPDQYTIIAVPLKLIKVLISELSSASGNSNLNPAALAELAEADSDDDDGDWEDVDNPLDLASAATKQGMFHSWKLPTASGNGGNILTPGASSADLMAFGDGTGSFMTRQRDDETQAYLTSFFREAAAAPGFGELFAALTPDEQERLRAVGQ